MTKRMAGFNFLRSGTRWDVVDWPEAGDWPFFLIEGWYGDTTTTPSGLIVPQEG